MTVSRVVPALVLLLIYAVVWAAIPAIMSRITKGVTTRGHDATPEPIAGRTVRIMSDP